MGKKSNSIVLIALIVALGGFLMGFDASVISGVNKFIEIEFDLTKLQLGWAVGSLTLSATLAMMVSGPISDAIGRKKVLTYAAMLYFISAVGSAIAPNFLFLVIARMIGGIGVGASLIIAPMYIAELAPPDQRGKMVSFNQLNIVIGITVAFFTNYLIMQLGQSEADWALSLKFDEYNWRWMLGLEALPAILYFFALFLVPKSPRWLAMKGEFDQARTIVASSSGPQEAAEFIESMKENMGGDEKKAPIADLLKPGLRLVLAIGLVIGILQQITGINSVFFYAPMIFEQSGVGEDASFSQAIWVGVINLVFTLIAIRLIDTLGRRPLLIGGVSGIIVCMSLLAYGFYQATYTLTDEALTKLSEEAEGDDRYKLTGIVDITFDSDSAYNAAIQQVLGDEDAKLHNSELTAVAINSEAGTYTLTNEALAGLSEKINRKKLIGAVAVLSTSEVAGTTYDSDLTYKAAIKDALGEEDAKLYESELIAAAANMNTVLILLGILGFVASFAVSVGPVMWVLFSELFPNWIRGIAISFVGLVNSAISFGVQVVFPWELDALGSSLTFLIYGLFAVAGLIFIVMKVPETKGKSLEELEAILIK